MTEPAFERIFDKVAADLTHEEMMTKLSLGGDILDCLGREGIARKLAEELVESVPKEVFEAKLDEFLHTPIGETVRTTARPIQYCSKCGKREDCMLCSKCKTANYCSKQCQQTDWPAHKRTCNKTVPKRAIYENKVLVLGSRAMYIPVILQTLVYLVFRKLQLDSGTWHASPADSVVHLTWDLVPVCSPQEFYALDCIAPPKHRDDGNKAQKREDADGDADGLLSMIQLTAADVVPRTTLAKYIRDVLSSSVRYAAMHTPPGPKDLVVDIICAATARSQGAMPKLHENYYLYTPLMREYLAALGEECGRLGSPFVKPRFDVTGLTSEEIMIRTVNEAIVLDTSNEWRLRTHPREHVEG